MAVMDCSAMCILFFTTFYTKRLKNSKSAIRSLNFAAQIVCVDKKKIKCHMSIEETLAMCAYWIPSNLIPFTHQPFDEQKPLFTEKELRDNALEVFGRMQLFVDENGNATDESGGRTAWQLNQKHFCISRKKKK